MTQIVQVHLFARFRDVFEADVLEIALPNPAAVTQLRAMLIQRNTESAALLSRSQVAVNGEFASDDIMIRSGDEIALIPPVSGG